MEIIVSDDNMNLLSVREHNRRCANCRYLGRSGPFFKCLRYPPIQAHKDNLPHQIFPTVSPSGFTCGEWVSRMPSEVVAVISYEGT